MTKQNTMTRNNYLSSFHFRSSLTVVLGLAVIVLFADVRIADAQSVGISNTTITPSNSSILEVRSSTKGVLIPRMSRAERLAIAPPTVTPNSTNEGGLLVYQHTANSGDPVGYYYWTGSVWERLLNASAAISLQTAYNGGNTIVTAGGLDVAISGPQRLTVQRSGTGDIEHARFFTTASSSATSSFIALKGARTTNVKFAGFRFINEGNSEGEYIAAEVAAHRKAPTKSGELRFLTAEDGFGGLAERMLVNYLGVGIGGSGSAVPAPTATQALVVAGRVKSTGINETSDARLKKNVQLISGALDKVLRIDGVTYDWRKDEFPRLGLTEGLQYGLIAQELEKVIPELVITDEEGWKSIEYSHLVPVLIEAIKEQQALIANQQEELTSLRAVKDEVETLKASVELLNDFLRTSQK